MTGTISPRAIGRRSDANDAPKAACLRRIPDKTIYTASPEQGTRRQRFRDNQFGRCGLNKLIIRRMSVNIPAKNKMPMTTKIAQPWRSLPTIRPNTFGERPADREDQDHLDEIGQGVWILVRMRRIGVPISRGFSTSSTGSAAATASAPARGLVLRSARGFIEAMGGRITAANRTGRKGAVFTITLPVAATATPPGTLP